MFLNYSCAETYQVIQCLFSKFGGPPPPMAVFFICYNYSGAALKLLIEQITISVTPAASGAEGAGNPTETRKTGIDNSSLTHFPQRNDRTVFLEYITRSFS